MKKENNTTHEIFNGPGTDIETLTEEQKDQVIKDVNDPDFFTPNHNKDLQVQEETNVKLELVSIDDIDLLDSATVFPVDLMSNYWKPAGAGDSKRVIFDRIDCTPVLSQKDPGVIIDLECAFFFVKEEGSVKQICNGSRRLVSALQNANVRNGMALEITYMGKKQNRTNPFESDNWSVKPLVINKK